MASLAFVANAVTSYMYVKCVDGSVDEYDVEHVTELYYTETPIVDGVCVTGKEGLYTYVDLDLPSGTMWATYNVGATKPTEYGDYFAWGETKPKKDYSWSTYKWYDGISSVTKYRKGLIFDADNKTVLDAEDDAATANWGSAWRMPTIDEIEELRDGCSWEWVNDFNGSGVNGQLGTSKKNRATIFLPAASNRRGTILYNAGKDGYYWSSSRNQSYSNEAQYLKFSDGHHTDQYYNGYRYYGQSVRAVLR